MKFQSLSAALAVFLAVFAFVSLPAEAQTIDLADKQVITDWIRLWRKPLRAFAIDYQSNSCATLVQHLSSGQPALTCNSAGRITEINFSVEQDLIDIDPVCATEIPTSLLGLSMLEDISFRGLGLRGTIPAGLFQMPRLTRIIMPINRLWGSVPATLSQAINMTQINLSGNLLSGVIPDVSRLTKLDILRFNLNNFQCPQPNFHPSIMTRARFPAMNTPGCTIHSNRIGGTDGSPFSFCGENILKFGSTLCHYMPIIYDNRTIESTRVWRVDLANHSIVMDVDRFRHAFYQRMPDKSISSTPFFTLDVFSLTTYPDGTRDRPAQFLTYPLEKYLSFKQDAQDPYKWTFAALVNGSASVLETIFEFRPPAEIKFSFVLRNFTWPIQSHNKIALNLQTTSPGGFVGSGSAGSCISPVSSPDLSGAYSLLTQCKSSAFEFNVSAEAGEIKLVSRANRQELGLVFPLEYDLDGLTTFFSYFSPLIYMSPLGRTPAINLMNYSDSPIPAFLAARGNPDPATLDQSIILGISLEMSRFVDTIVYDPTISLSSLFVESSSPTPLAPVDAALVENISTGAIVGIIVAVVAVVGIVLVVIFVPPVRQAIQPFFRGRKGRVQEHRSHHYEEDSDGDSNDSGTTKPLGDAPKSSNVCKPSSDNLTQDMESCMLSRGQYSLTHRHDHLLLIHGAQVAE